MIEMLATNIQTRQEALDRAEQAATEGWACGIGWQRYARLAKNWLKLAATLPGAAPAAELEAALARAQFEASNVCTMGGRPGPALRARIWRLKHELELSPR